MRRLLLIADDPTFVRAFRPALRNAAALRVVATVDGRASARPALCEHAPDIVLIDEMCQRTDALARLREANEVAPRATVVLLTTGARARDDAIRAGAHAVVSRRLHPATLAGRLWALADLQARTSA